MKKYVKEYSGYKVPEGATHWLGGKFAKWINNEAIGVIGCFQGATWRKCSRGMPRQAIELPEAPQEWNGEGLPPVGSVCEIAKLCDALSWNKGVVDFYGKEKCIVTFCDGREAAFMRKKIVFRPLKTHLEKEREKFISEAIEYGGDGVSFMDFAYNLFNAGFTAPKAADNDQK